MLYVKDLLYLSHGSSIDGWRQGLSLMVDNYVTSLPLRYPHLRCQRIYTVSSPTLLSQRLGARKQLT